MENRPKVSVVMPVYNGERYLREAIGSILNQTFGDFEFIIINDGSTDSTEKIIQSFKDPRIVYISNGKNLGLSKSFNIGINAAKGAYLARMDADDISTPKRFERQVQFLEKRPQVDIVGSNLRFIDEYGKFRSNFKRQADHMDIKFSSLFSTPMMHPTVMGKTSVFKTHHYNEALSNSEDYELWSRLLFNTNTHFANIHEPLLLYRTYPHSFTQTLNLDKRIVSAHNAITNIERYTPLSSKEKDLLVKIRQEQPLSTAQLLKIFMIYLRSAGAFSRKENLGLKKALKIYSSLFSKIYFLVKYRIKKLLKR